MSFSQTARKVTDAVGLTQKTRFIKFRTNYARPMRRRGENGIMEEFSKCYKAGDVAEVATDDQEFASLLERRYVYEVQAGRDEKGRPIYTGDEPQDPPQMDPPISMSLDPNHPDVKKAALLEKLVDGLTSGQLTIIPAKGGAA